MADGKKSKSERIVRKVYIGEDAYRHVTAYAKRWRMPLEMLWPRMVLDWSVMWQAGGGGREYLERIAGRFYNADLFCVYKSVALSPQQYEYLFKIGKEYFGKFSRFFPVMVDDWVRKYCTGIESDGGGSGV